jgi:PAS domain S-box-containing protein
MEPLPGGVQEFIEAVDKAYHENDEDRLMLERAFDLSSQELMQVNDELRDALGRFESIIENTPFVAIQGFDRHGTILHWNNACEAIYGYAANEAKGNRFQNIVLSRESISDFEHTLERIWTTCEPTQPREWEVHNRGGETRWVFSTMFPIIEDHEVVEVFCMDLDVTDRKRLENQLLQAQKMEAIGTLAGGIAHDFNNLLMGIQGYTQIMLMGLDPSHPHYGKLKRIEMQIKSGSDLSDQLLGFARGGRYEVKPANLNEIIEQTSQTFGRTKKEIVVYLRLSPDLWTAEVDRGQMEQVLLNLFVNAWQAMPGGGNLHLSTENVILSESYTKSYDMPAGRYIKTSVTDTGAGMDEKTKERIFEPFFTTREMGRGTGLGLATVYGIIKAHRGIITVYSEMNHGTTFNIYLPSSDKKPVHEKAYSEEIRKGSGTVLVVDDEAFILEVTAELLENLGYRVLTARGGKEAIDQYRSSWKDIDLIMLDMIMPEMSGDMTFDELCAINPDAKVILASGYSLTGRAKQLMEKGAVSFIQKPYQLSELSRKLADALKA